MDFENDPKMSTNYVQTRWYRAPELLLDNEAVSKETDLWSVGCIMAELLGRRVMFRGSSPTDQLRQIIKKLGTPKDCDIKGSKNGRDFLKQLPYHYPVDFAHLFPCANAQALDLLKKLLEFNYEKRISAAEALKHPYFSSLYSPTIIKTSPQLFDFCYEDDLVMDIDSPSDGRGIKREAYETIVRFQMERFGSTREQSTEVSFMKPPVKEPLVNLTSSPGASPISNSKKVSRRSSQPSFEKRINHDSKSKPSSNAAMTGKGEDKSMSFLKRVRSVLKKF